MSEILAVLTAVGVVGAIFLGIYLHVRAEFRQARLNWAARESVERLTADIENLKIIFAGDEEATVRFAARILELERRVDRWAA